MESIRTFQNVDLPHLARIWCEHWSYTGAMPPVSVAMIEQAVLSRTFFDSTILLVATNDRSHSTENGPEHDDHFDHRGDPDTASSDSDARPEPEAWCHLIPDPLDPKTAVLAAICFTHAGLAVCDSLLTTAEQRAREAGFEQIVVGPLRDQHCGYLGLPPLGHGIGVSALDARTGSLLSRHGYTHERQVTRMVVHSNPYRMPVKRSLMQLRRTTRTERESWFPADAFHASAMSHMDIEQHSLINHLNGQHMASVALWLSDSECQIMSIADAILDLSATEQPGDLTEAEQFLIGAIVSTLGNRRVFRVETAVDSRDKVLLQKLAEINFQAAEQGSRWIKPL